MAEVLEANEEQDAHFTYTHTNSFGGKCVPGAEGLVAAAKLAMARAHAANKDPTQREGIPWEELQAVCGWCGVFGEGMLS